MIHAAIAALTLGDPFTCGGLKSLYKDNSCCGAPVDTPLDGCTSTSSGINASVEWTVRNSRSAYKETANMDQGGSAHTSKASAVGHDFLESVRGIQTTRNYFGSVIKYNKSLYYVTPAHINSYKAAVDPMTQYAYMNFAPEFNMDYGSIDYLAFLNEEASDPNTDHYRHLMRQPVGVGVGSDVWGFVNVRGDGLKTRYMLSATSKGMVISYVEGDATYNGLFGKSVSNFVQFIPSIAVNQWGDAKVYDVSNITIHVANDLAVPHFKRGALLRLPATGSFGYQPTIKILSMGEVAYSNELNMTSLNFRCKTEYSFPKEGWSESGIHFAEGGMVEGDFKIVSQMREIAGYLIKESGDRVLAMNLKPLLEKKKAYITKNFFDPRPIVQTNPNPPHPPPPPFPPNAPPFYSGNFTCGEGETGMKMNYLATGTYQSENGVIVKLLDGTVLINVGPPLSGSFTEQACIPAGSESIILNLNDNYGDGYNGNGVTIEVEGLGMLGGIYTLNSGSTVDFTVDVVSSEFSPPPPPSPWDGTYRAWEFDKTKVVSQGYITGAHNVYVNEEQGILYIAGARGVETSLPGDTVSCLLADLKEDPYRPPIIAGLDFLEPSTNPGGVTGGGISGDGTQMYVHDIVVESYDKHEQMDLLGLSETEATDGVRFFAIASTGRSYAVIDVTNTDDCIMHLSSSIDGRGYDHQAWFTTDKKYIVISDELQPDYARYGYSNRQPLMRVYSNGTGFVVGTVVQELIFPIPALSHNQYTVSNKDPFSKTDVWEDWIVGANYNAGTNGYKIRYNMHATPDMYDSKMHYELRMNPFDVEILGYLVTDTTASKDTDWVSWTWSVYPFWEMGVPARDIWYVSNSKDSWTAFSYRQGVQNTRSSDPLNDGKVQKLKGGKFARKKASFPKKKPLPAGETAWDETPMTEEHMSRWTSVGSIPSAPLVRKSDNRSVGLVMLPIGTNHPLDMTIFKYEAQSFYDAYYSLEVAEMPPKAGEVIYCMSGNDLVSGVVKKSFSTDYYYVDFPAGVEGYGYGMKTYMSRVGETLASVPAKGGDSGNPCIDSEGFFVGMINSADVVGNTVGITSGEWMKKYLGNSEISLARSDYNGFAGIANNLYEGPVPVEDDPYKIGVVAVNPRTGKFHGSVSFYTGAQYFNFDARLSGFAPNEQGIYPDLFGSGGQRKILNLGGQILYTACWPGLGGNSASKISTYKIEVETEALSKLLFAEELRGTYQNRGPAMIYLGVNKEMAVNATTFISNTTGVNMTHTWVRLYEVSESAAFADDLFSTDPEINTFTSVVNGYGGNGVHPATTGDVMKGLESNVSVTSLSTWQEMVETKTPTWGSIGAAYGGACLPFATKLIDFTFFRRSKDAFFNIADYPLGEGSYLEWVPSSGLNEEIGSAIGEVIYDIGYIAGNEHVCIGVSGADSCIASINGVPVTSDNTIPMLLSHPFKVGEKINVGFADGSTKEYASIPARYNTYGLF